MMEVLHHFPAIQSIAEYLAMPQEHRALYQEFVLVKREEEASLAGAKLERDVLKR